jgi:hypothetical protein
LKLIKKDASKQAGVNGASSKKDMVRPVKEEKKATPKQRAFQI